MPLSRQVPGRGHGALRCPGRVEGKLGGQWLGKVSWSASSLLFLCCRKAQEKWGPKRSSARFSAGRWGDPGVGMKVPGRPVASRGWNQARLPGTEVWAGEEDSGAGKSVRGLHGDC